MSRVGWLGMTLALLLTGTQSGCGVMGGLNQVAAGEDCKAGDKECDRKGFDKPLAVGGVLRPDLSFKLRGAGAPAVHLVAADEEVLSTENGEVRGVGPGMSAVLVMSDDGMVLDMFHVWVKAPTKVELYAPRGKSDRLEPVSGRVELLRGELLELTSAVQGEGQTLAGEVPQEWALSKKDVVELLEDGASGRRRLLALEPGETTLTIHAGKAFASLVVSVHGKDTKEGSR